MMKYIAVFLLLTVSAAADTLYWCEFIGDDPDMDMQSILVGAGTNGIPYPAKNISAYSCRGGGALWSQSQCLPSTHELVFAGDYAPGQLYSWGGDVIKTLLPKDKVPTTSLDVMTSAPGGKYNAGRVYVGGYYGGLNASRAIFAIDIKTDGTWDGQIDYMSGGVTFYQPERGLSALMVADDVKGDLYIRGTISAAGSGSGAVSLGGMAMYEASTSTWNNMGFAMPLSNLRYVNSKFRAMAARSGRFYMAGDGSAATFSGVTCVSTNTLMIYENKQWSCKSINLPSKMPLTFQSMWLIGSEVWGICYDTRPGMGCKNTLWKFTDGSSSAGTVATLAGPNGYASVASLAAAPVPKPDKVYMAGWFSAINGQLAKNIGVLDVATSTWSQFGQGAKNDPEMVVLCNAPTPSPK